MYCTAEEVYQSTSLSESVVSRPAVEGFIHAAEEQLCRLSHTIYLINKGSSTVTSSTDSIITDSNGAWVEGSLPGYYVHISGGTGVGQVRLISANTSTTITVSDSFITTPDDTSIYRVFYSPKSPIIDTTLDGNDSPFIYLDYYPLLDVESLSVSSIDIDISSLYKYKEFGKIQLSQTSSTRLFTSYPPQALDINYSYGVMGLPYVEKRYITLLASLKTLAAQMGGTYNTPSQYTLPEGSVTIGQAYVNIRGTFDVMTKELALVEKDVIKYPVIM